LVYYFQNCIFQTFLFLPAEIGVISNIGSLLKNIKQNNSDYPIKMDQPVPTWFPSSAWEQKIGAPLQPGRDKKNNYKIQY
jgi:hypothetical protein